jgi:hypothetical protein
VPGSSSRRQHTTSRAHPSELCPALQLPSSAPGAFPGHPGAAKTPSPGAKDTFAIRVPPRSTCPSTGQAGRADPRVRARRLRGGSTFRTLRLHHAETRTRHAPGDVGDMGHAVHLGTELAVVSGCVERYRMGWRHRQRTDRG